MLFSLALAVTVLSAGVVVFAGLYTIHSVLQEYRRDRVPALLYHHFIPKGKIDGNYDPVCFCYDTAFAEQMNYLYEKGYSTISLDDFLAFKEGKQALPSKPIIVTFDDGFMSNYLYAFPILKNYGMKATVFVTVDQDSENFKKYGAIDFPLTPEQLREMSDYGISIESHTMTHRYLTELETKVVRWELQESKRSLENMVKRPVKFLATPSGAYNKTVRQLAKEAGYKAVFGALKGSNNISSDPYALRRVVIARDFSIEDFEQILKPSALLQLRLTSFLQNLLLSILGPGRFDAFRDTLYQTRFARFLIRGQLRYLVGGMVALALAVMVVSISILFRY